MVPSLARVRLVLLLPAVSALSAVYACSSSSAGPAPALDGGPSADGGDVDAAPDGGVGPLTMRASVAPGADVYHCATWTAPPAAAGGETFFVGASHTYGAGVHHVLVFRTDPGAPVVATERECFAPDDVMPHARAQVYGGEAKTGAFAMPPDVGLPLRAGESLLVQVHYLNATAAAVDARMDLQIQTTTVAPARRAGAFYFADPFVDVGPGQKARAAMRCAMPAEATLLAVTGYAHARATDFAAFADTAAPPPSSAPFYHAPGSANPLPLQGAVPLEAGGHVRFACTFDNTRGTAEVLGGARNDADEQCVLSGLYVPDQGDDVSLCRVGADGFGTGAATCDATRACVDVCPAGSAPPADLGLGDGGAADPCWQRCIVASCSDASQLLFAVRACAASKCAAACAAGPGAGCTSCTQTSCPSEVAACAADTCP